MKWNHATRDKAIALAKRGYTDKAIAEKLGVSQQCFSGWRMRKPDFRAAMDQAKLPTRAVRLLLNAQNISPNSRRGRRLIEMAWQVHRQESRRTEVKQPEPPAEQNQPEPKQQDKRRGRGKTIYGGPLSAEDVARIDAIFPPLDLDLFFEDWPA